MSDYSKASEVVGLPSSNTDKLASGSSYLYCNAEKCCRQTSRPKLYLYNTGYLEE